MTVCYYEIITLINCIQITLYDFYHFYMIVCYYEIITLINCIQITLSIFIILPSFEKAVLSLLSTIIESQKI